MAAWTDSALHLFQLFEQEKIGNPTRRIVGRKKSQIPFQLYGSSIWPRVTSFAYPEIQPMNPLCWSGKFRPISHFKLAVFSILDPPRIKKKKENDRDFLSQFKKHNILIDRSYLP